MSETVGKPVPVKLIFLGGLVAVAISITLVLVYEPKDLLTKILLAFIAETGFACIIAVLIIIIVDRREKEEFRNYITRSDSRLAARNILAYVSDLDVPVGVSRELEAYLNATPFFKNFQDYTIVIKRMQDDSVVVTFNTTIEFENISLIDQDFVGNSYLSVEKKVKNPTAGYFTYLKIERAVGPQKTFQVVVEKDLNSSHTNLLDYSEQATFKVKPGERVRVTQCAQKTHSIYGSDFVRQRYLCSRMKFNLIFDRNDLDLEALVFCPGDNGPEATRTESGMFIEVNRALLANSGIMFSWKPAQVTSP